MKLLGLHHLGGAILLWRKMIKYLIFHQELLYAIIYRSYGCKYLKELPFVVPWCFKYFIVYKRRRKSCMASDRQKYIRNFCIIAHIDHGKSTLADRLIEKTGVLSAREMEEQVLDNMDLERERGITIKLQSVRLNYKALDGNEYTFNLIDTPGHVDFTYEVSRSLAACEGAIVVVDATQGIEAQTLANVYLALDNNLELYPVINKIDLPSADPEFVKKEVEDVIGLDASNAALVSAKEGIGIEEVLEGLVKYIPAPRGDESAPLKALIFDSYYDSYKGVIAIIRVIDGSIKPGTKMRMMEAGVEYDVVEVGTFRPGMLSRDCLMAGDVGYVAASIKNVKDVHVGDTITDASNPCKQALPGYRKVTPMVYCGIYPADGADYDNLRDALEKLQLNDAALMFEPETSAALGFGFRCGFLGLLHMEIIQERLEREYDLYLVTTAPSVIYHIIKTNGEKIEVSNPSNLPELQEIERMEEPIVKATIMSPTEYVGPIMDLCQNRRGTFINMEYMEATRVMLHYDLPLNEIIYDFFDALKSRTKGYASFDYELKGYEESELVKLDILLNAEIVDALSFIVHKDKAYSRGRNMAEKLKDVIPRQMFEIPIQAAVGSKIIARETIRAMRKDVLAKCYGGDITRKKKLLEKQKEGKKRMRQVGNVELPQEAFMSVLKLGD
jgi:GTP-binding protein LepA